MKKRYAMLIFCLMILLIFSGCQRRLMPNQTLPGKNPNISAAKDRADSFYGVVASDTKAQTGISGTNPVTYTVRNGSSLKIIGKYDGNYVVILPNNQIGIMPSGSVMPSPSPATGQNVASKVPTNNQAGDTQRRANEGVGMSQGSTMGGDRLASPGGTTSGTGNTVGGTTGGRMNVPGSNSSMGGGNINDPSTMITLVNQARTQAGLSSLNTNANLSGLASMKARDIVSKNYFSHTSPTYGSPFDMMKQYGVSYLYAGENLAANQSVQSAEQALMGSPEHRANILSPNFTDIGVGVAQRSDGSNVYVQMFIGK